MSHAHLRHRILFGAAFYDEYRVGGSLDRDLDLMAEAGFSVIRVGESVWSKWEPEPGRFELDWLQPILDGAGAREIDVIVGTPTYAIPPWLQRAHPEIAAEDRTGRRVPWGYRQEINYADPSFLAHAESVVRAVAGRYASHPSVIGFQVDNEPGLHLLHNSDVFEGFLDYLKSRYENVEALNEAWGLVFWSHQLRDWHDLWRPDGNHSPQYALEWRRYQALVVSRFIHGQAEIVREYARPDQFVMTCISYERPAVNDVDLVAGLDIATGNPYYRMQDGLRIGVEVDRPEIWWSSGVWGLFEQADRMFSSAQAPFLVTETNAQSIGQSHWENHPPYPGQIAQAAFALISRGARMVEYWQWQTLAFGIETYWGGVLPHSGRPGRIYREVAALGRRIRALEPYLDDYRPDSDVTLLYSTDTRWSFDGYPPLAAAGGGPDERSYLRIFDAFYRGAFENGAQVNIAHAAQLIAQPTEQLVAEHPVLVVPSLYVATDAELEKLVDFARGGGHLVVGIRTGYGDHLARARYDIAPGILREAAGISYDEYTNLDEPIAVRSSAQYSSAIDGGGKATGWADALELHGAEALFTFESGIYAGRPAVTTHSYGRGRVTYVATVPDAGLARAILAWALPSRRSHDWMAGPGVTISSGRGTAGRVWFVSNWTPEPTGFTVPRAMRLDGEAIAAGHRQELDAWSVVTLLEEISE